MAAVNAGSLQETNAGYPLPYRTVAATGTIVGNAAALAVGMNLVTAGDGTVGVVLPAAVGNGPVLVFNSSASTLKVYGPSGTGVNNNTANTAVSIATYKGGEFWPLPNGNWGGLSD